MSSKKADSNRKNALKSTGPNDTSVTRMNATKHGLTATGVTAFDAELYEPMLERYRLELQPRGEVEELLVQRLVLYGTRLLRAATLSAEYMASATKPSIADERLAPSLLDTLTLAATGEPSARHGRLSELTASLKELPEVVSALVEGGDADVVAALNRFSSAVEALPGGKKSSLDALKIVETLETRFQKYETQLENRYLRCLNELERLQRLRAGEAVPPPLNVNVAVAPAGGEVM